MNGTRFDTFTKRLGAPATRRETARLLAGALLGGVLAQRQMLPSAAQDGRPDRDNDGLYDDDEVYGHNHGYVTNPDDWDTDRDGVGDGQEIYNLNNGLGGNTNPTVNENAAPPPPNDCPGVYYCTGYCTDLATNKYHCGACGNVCPGRTECRGGVCALACSPGQTSCGDYCADLLTDHGNCGACGSRCSQIGQGYNCVNGACVKVCKLRGEICTPGNYECCGDMLCQQSERYAYCVGAVG
jgi:hypothetical protein